jgi:hypothetical protein
MQIGFQLALEGREVRRMRGSGKMETGLLDDDCLTGSEAGRRFLIDYVSVDRVVLGSDWPYVGWDPSPVAWVQGLQSLIPEEKDKILWQNLERLFGL